MPQLRLHLCGDVYETDDFIRAKRLAAMLNQALFSRLTCSGCQHALEIPIEVIERMPPSYTALITPEEHGGVWHPIYNLTRDTERWVCGDCWIPYIASLRPPGR